jgi:hypothetical protein
MIPVHEDAEMNSHARSIGRFEMVEGVNSYG